jgi:hypothetical protein
MNWLYRQASGVLMDPSGLIVGIGYSGAAGTGKNIPSMQAVHNVGPIPQGSWSIAGRVECTSDLSQGVPCPDCHGTGWHSHGPFVLRLEPEPGTETFSRAGFLIHGDSLAHPGGASEGCIVMPRDVREKISASSDRRLEVVA